MLCALQYSAVPQTEGAPLRSVTVKDVISDLPPIANGQCQDAMQYAGKAIVAEYSLLRTRFAAVLDASTGQSSPPLS